MAVAAQTISRANLREWAFTMDYILKRVQDHVFSHSPTLAIFASRDLGAFGGTQLSGSGHLTAPGGHTVMVRARLGEHAGAKRAAGGFDTHNVAPDDNVRMAEFTWRFYTHAAVVSEHDLEINKGSLAISSFLEDQTESVLLALSQLLTQDMHALASPANGVISLDDLISANDAVGGLSGQTFANWNSRGLSARGTAVGAISFTSGSFAAQGLSDMRKAFNNGSEGMIQPQAIVTDYDTHQRYEGALQPSERFQGAVRVADGSFQALAFRTAPVLADNYCAAGSMYFLRPGADGISLTCLQGADLAWGDWKPSANQTVMVRPIKMTCALVIHNRKYGANKLVSITD